MAIINPWIFYLIEVLKGLKEVSVVAIFYDNNNADLYRNSNIMAQI